MSATLKKEFGEEAMNSLEASEAEKEVIKGHVDHIFSQGVQVSVCSEFRLVWQTLMTIFAKHVLERCVRVCVCVFTAGQYFACSPI